MQRQLQRDQRPARLLDEDQAWSHLQALAALASQGAPAEDGWPAAAALSFEVRELLQLYLPLCTGAPSATLVLARLSQSLDGRIAADGGRTELISGVEDVTHMHRLRALFDAVIVGARTIENDDPRLTTRLVRGKSPLRVVLDPRARLPGDHRVFSDGAAPTLRVVACAEREPAAFEGRTLFVPGKDGQLDLRVLVRELRARGHARLLIEGGGVTVGRFRAAGLLDRLHLTISPRLLGCGTPSGIAAPTAAPLAGSCRRFVLGRDTLFDCNLRAEPRALQP